MNKIYFHEYLAQLIAICGKKQKVIAKDLGYKKPNIITMFKQGKTKVPLDKITPFAESIGTTPYSLLEKAIKEYIPGIWSTIEKIHGHAVTDSEFELVKSMRNASNLNAPLSFHEFLAEQIAICGKSQKLLSEELGYNKPNIITMFKQGKTKVPYDKIVILAEAIDADPVFLLEKAMTEYEPEKWSAIANIVGHPVTDNEFEMLSNLRNSSKSTTQDITTTHHEPTNEHMVLVPVAADGTIFHPGLKRQHGYQIGSKTQECYISTYKDALEHLKTMTPKPYWRRSNEKGTPGIVAGVAWKEIPQKELDQLATQAPG